MRMLVDDYDRKNYSQEDYYGPLARYVKLRLAHAPGVPGTFSPPPLVSNLDMHHGTWVTHVSWCMLGSLTSSFLRSRWRVKRSGIPCACAIRNFTYLVRGPWDSPATSCGPNPVCKFMANPSSIFIGFGELFLAYRRLFRNPKISPALVFRFCNIWQYNRLGNLLVLPALSGSDLTPKNCVTNWLGMYWCHCIYKPQW